MDDFIASASPDLPCQITVGEFMLDRETIRVWRKDKPLQISIRQFRLLDYFMQRPNTALSFKELKAAVWGLVSTIEDATVAAEIARLRRAMGYRYGKNPIKTVRGVGYLFESAPTRATMRRPRVFPQKQISSG
jgi:two-component system phosphate regulon response regulator PhoB